MFTATTDLQMSLCFSLRTAVFEIHAIWDKCTKWPPNWPWTLKYQRYQYKTWVHWHIRRPLKIPYLGMKLCHWQKIQTLHIYSLSTPKKLKFSLFSLYGQPFPRYGPIFKIAIFATWNSVTDKRCRRCTYTLFLPTLSKCSWVSLYGQRFPGYGNPSYEVIFKIAIFW